MSYTVAYLAGGESRDPIMEHPSIVLSGSSVTVDSTAARVVSPGTRCLKFPLATAASKAIILTGNSILTTTYDAQMGVAMAYVGVSGTPTSGMGLMSRETQGGARPVRINTSLQVEIYDGTGALAGTSKGTISTTGMTHVMVAHYQFASTNGSVINVWIDKKWDSTFIVNSYTIPAMWGEWLPVATDRGADLFLGHVSTRTSTAIHSTPSPEDAPWLTAYPLIEGCGGASLPPTGNGTHTAWAQSDGGTADFSRVDEFPNDGDTTWVGTDTNDAKETYTYSAANPVTGSPLHVAQRLAHRTVGTKINALFLYRDGAGNEVTNNTIVPGTSYVGTFDLMGRPAGGDWQASDFDLTGGGVSDLEFGGQGAPVASGTPGDRWTSLPGPEIWETNEDMPFGRYVYQPPIGFM